MECPYCGEEAALVTGKALYPGRSDLADKSFWRCSPCDAHVGCHPGTQEPLGTPVNRAIRRARQQCHAVFDPLWQEAWRLPCYSHLKDIKDKDEEERARKRIAVAARTRTYAFMAWKLGIPPEECHIGQMTDIAILRTFYSVATRTNAQEIRDWWRRNHDACG